MAAEKNFMFKIWSVGELRSCLASFEVFRGSGRESNCLFVLVKTLAFKCLWRLPSSRRVVLGRGLSTSGIV